MAGEKPDLVECPVCEAVVPVQGIEKHVDQCLMAASGSGSNRTNTDKTATSSSRKRQSSISTKSDILTKKQKTEFVKPLPSKVTKEKAPPSTSSNSQYAPLYEIVRPKSLEDFIGHEKVVGERSILRVVAETGSVPSIIFWGPPGCGKTTLARIIADSGRSKGNMRFVQLSATTSGVADVKEVIKIAKNDRKMLKKGTILFIDEIHRFNKLQQDTFLPHIEDGTIVLLGATTENPSFQLNSALLSRCHVIVLEKLSTQDISVILRNALRTIGVVEISEYEQEKPKNSEFSQRTDPESEVRIKIDSKALKFLALHCDGDARSAINGLHLSVNLKQSQREHGTNSDVIDIDDVKRSLQRNHLLYDKAGDEHYNLISALIKSMRGSHASAALYWLARMLTAGEDPLYIARRIVVFASEDVGLADPNALVLAVSAFHACHFIGMPECELNLSHAVVYMARAEKSRDIFNAYHGAKSMVLNHQGPLPSVPLHLRNAPTKLMKELGYGQMSKNNDDSEMIDNFLPPGMEGCNFFNC